MYHDKMVVTDIVLAFPRMGVWSVYLVCKGRRSLLHTLQEGQRQPTLESESNFVVWVLAGKTFSAFAEIAYFIQVSKTRECSFLRYYAVFFKWHFLKRPCHFKNVCLCGFFPWGAMGELHPTQFVWQSPPTCTRCESSSPVSCDSLGYCCLFSIDCLWHFM